MKLVRLSLLVLSLFTTFSASAAGCIFNGKTYPPGSVIGDRVCQPDGAWRVQNRNQKTADAPGRLPARVTRP